MKISQVVSLIGLAAVATFSSCRKDYTCTCTTVVGASSVDVKHSVSNAYYNDAKTSCNNYQDQANSTLPGGTTCHL